MTCPPAVVVGLDHVNGIQAARLLAARGVPVVGVVQDPAHVACRTTVCARIVPAGPGVAGIVDALAALGPTLPSRGVLVPSTDAHVRAVSRHRDRLAPWFEVVLPPAPVVELLMDKGAFYAHAADHGFRVPRSVLLHGPADVDRAARELVFPCVLKPPLSATPAWEAQSPLKAYVLPDAAALAAAYRRLGALADVLIVQEWVPGGVDQLYSVNGYFRDGAPVATFVARKLRQWPTETGESCLGEEVRNDAVLDVATRLFGELDYTGLAYLEVKRHAGTGEHVIIEPNVGRPTGRSAIAEAGGVALLYTMWCDAVGRPLPAGELVQRYTGVKWMHLRKDLQAAVSLWRRGELTPGEWWRSVRGRKAYALLSLRDPGPFLADLARAARLALSPAERRARDYTGTAAAVVVEGDAA